MEISIDSFGRKCTIHIRCLSKCVEISIDTWWSRLSAAFVQSVNMEITVDFFGREFNSEPYYTFKQLRYTWKSSYTCDLKGCQIFKQNISIICYTRNDFSDIIKLSTIKVWRRICYYHIIVPAKQDFNEFWCKAVEVNWIKLIPW